MKIQIDCASFELERYRQLITDSFNCEPVLTGQAYVVECPAERAFPAIGKMDSGIKHYVGMDFADVESGVLSLRIYDDYREQCSMKAIITAFSEDVGQYKDAIEKVFGEPVTLENEAYTVNCPYEQALYLMSKLEDEIDALDCPPIAGFRISLIDEDSFFMEIEDTP